MQQWWRQGSMSDMRENKTLKQSEAIVNNVYERMKEVRSHLNLNAQKYSSKLSIATQMLESLESDYRVLGQPMEESLLNAENNLREECFDMLKNRLNQTKECIVFFVVFVERQEKRRIKVAEYAEHLRSLYTDLGITTENATDDLDKLILTDDVAILLVVHRQSLPITNDYLEKYKSRIDSLYRLCVIAFHTSFPQEERENTIQEYCEEIRNLWRVLETPQNAMDEFSSSCPTSVSSDAINYVPILFSFDVQYQQYIHSLQEELKSKLRELIPRIRGDIQRLFLFSYPFQR